PGCSVCIVCKDVVCAQFIIPPSLLLRYKVKRKKPLLFLPVDIIEKDGYWSFVRRFLLTTSSIPSLLSRARLLQQKKKTSPNNMHRTRLTRLFARYNPKLLNSVDKVLDQYKGNEDELFRTLERQYHHNNSSSSSPTTKREATNISFQDPAGSSTSASITTTPSSPSPRGELANEVGAPWRVSWPDPDPSSKDAHASIIRSDDVSGLSGNIVGRILQPRNEADIAYALQLGRRFQLPVCVRGTQHSMGGQCVPSHRGILLDVKRFNQVTYNQATNLVTCEAGATWSDLIVHLNPYGLSPRTMQSYCSFSVGGTVSVNGHGITTDFCLNESIMELRLMLWDGRVVVCGPNAPTEEGKELFGLAVGGYGLFGVILTITMTVSKNVNLEQLSLEVPIHAFPEIFETTQQDKDIDIKLTRIDITTFDTVTLFLFRKTDSVDGSTTISALGAEARQMGSYQKKKRFAIERNTGLALDWDSSKDRNSLMYESAQPLARLVSPFLSVDDTFILQEYFVPKRGFTSWIRAVKPILKELDTSTVGITLMNITIRFVHQDAHSVLKYAAHKDGMYAFVLYLRIQRTNECDARLGTFQRRLIDETLLQQGTFYLPYRKQYTHSQVLQSYPNMPTFVAKKQLYDPHGLFGNLWFEEYGTLHIKGAYPSPMPAVFRGGVPVLKAGEPQPLSQMWDAPPPTMPLAIAEGSPFRIVPNRLANAFHALLSNNASRQAFRDLFLERVFQVRSATEVYRAMWVAYYRGTASQGTGSGGIDDAIYQELYRMLREQETPIQKGRQAFRSLAQIDEQRSELSNELVRLLYRLGKSAQIRSYVSIGDHGRLVKSLKETLSMPKDAPVWIVHDDDGVDSVGAAVERSDADPVGIFVPIDYRGGATFPAVPSNTADLVTMNQGLHHIPQERLADFLREVHRVLRPGGLFIFREHNAESHLIPMLEMAHSVFNALTGVLPLDEKKEIRAFRPVLEWRALVQSACGLVDTMVYEMQQDDPTVDEMMCFFKPPWTRLPPAVAVKEEETVRVATAPHEDIISSNVTKPIETKPPPGDFAAPLITAFAQLPNLLVSLGAQQIDSLCEGVQSLEKLLIDMSPNADLAKSVIQKKKLAVSGSGAMTLHHVIPRDLVHAYRAVSRRVAQGNASTEEAFIISLVNGMQKAMMGEGGDTNDGDAALKNISTNTSAATTAGHTGVDELPTPSAVLVLFNQVLHKYPRLLASDYWTEAGISQSLQSIALSKELNVERAAATLAAKLDAQSWKDFQSAVHDLVNTNPLLPLRMELVLNKETSPGKGTNPWHRAVVAVLGSKTFEVTQAQRWYASVAGYGEFISLIDIAKEVRAAQDDERESEEVTRRGPNNMTPLAKILHDGLQGLTNDVRETVMTTKLHSIHDIDRLILVEHRGEDVTQSILESSSFFKAGSLLLEGVDLDKELRYTSLSNTRIGQFFGGPMIVRVQYVSSKPPAPSSIAPHIDAIRRNLRIRGLRPTSGLVAAPSWTFFKLCEWMQVEMAQHFSNSMEHTPWYRYPFTEVMGAYLRVLGNECRAVQKRHGFVSAYLSMPFVSSAVPAAVMGLLFGQMQLLAAPVKLALGESYEGKAALVQVVHFVVPEVASDPSPRWSSRLIQLCNGKQPVRVHTVDAHISSIQASSTEERHRRGAQQMLSLYSVELPAFKPFTDGIRELSRIAGAQIIDIVSQEVIQVKIAVSATNSSTTDVLLAKVLEVPTVTETARYAYPALAGGGKPHTNTTVFVAVAVQIPYLLHLVRLCDSRLSELRVVQVFDFWKG
ncbi:FAD-linked oxidase, putative, partial [Bodo saltans]